MAAETPTIETRPVAPDDEPFLFALFRSQKGAELAAAGLPQALIENLVRSQYAGQRMSYRAQHPRADHEILLVDGTPVGAAWVAREPAHLHVVDVLIDPARRGRGAGTAWLVRLQAEAGAAGLPVTLEVAADNPGASRLYERLGFVVTGATDTHISMCWTP